MTRLDECMSVDQGLKPGPLHARSRTLSRLRARLAPLLSRLTAYSPRACPCAAASRSSRSAARRRTRGRGRPRPQAATRHIALAWACVGALLRSWACGGRCPALPSAVRFACYRTRSRAPATARHALIILSRKPSQRTAGVTRARFERCEPQHIAATQIRHSPQFVKRENATPWDTPRPARARRDSRVANVAICQFRMSAPSARRPRAVAANPRASRASSKYTIDRSPPGRDNSQRRNAGEPR